MRKILTTIALGITLLGTTGCDELETKHWETYDGKIGKDSVKFHGYQKKGKDPVYLLDVEHLKYSFHTIKTEYCDSNGDKKVDKFTIREDGKDTLYHNVANNTNENNQIQKKFDWYLSQIEAKKAARINEAIQAK
jgi:hypothetical protein